ncbi:MAG: anthranilate phosphoribosyltransferase [Candidatus Omnitrophica bacterium]|nr:anthranilate phosphoribosyltransferase [Candidatus Omnitrophota bacterium]
MIKQAIIKLSKNSSLTSSEAEKVFEEIFKKKATHVQIAAFLVALSMKGECEEEITAAAKVVRDHACKINVRTSFIGIENKDESIIDTCGTGGSGANKFNISTAVSFVVAAGGAKVAKHGNRAMSSSCGSADAFEALGVKIDTLPCVMESAIRKINVGFLYAPLYHPALKDVAGIRREIGIRTVFNILGPLCNPAFTTHQLLGVHSENLLGVMAKVLKNIGIKRAFVVCSKDLKDEVSLSSKTEVAFLDNKKIKRMILSPSDFGLKRIKLKDLEVKSAKDSASVIKDILNGKKGAPRSIVLANAACCFYILGKAQTLKEGVKLAAEIVDSGQAKKKLLELRKFIKNNA